MASTIITGEASTTANNRYLCEICFKAVFEKKKFLRLHIEKYHKKDNYYVCNKCTYESKQLSTLTKHVTNKHFQPLTSTVTSTITRDFPCKICDIYFKDKSSLSSHNTVTHMIYTCDKCKFTNKVLTNVTKHVRIEHPQSLTSTDATGGAITGAKYPCEICYKNAYKTTTYLNKHIKVYHMTYACDKCEYTTIDFDNFIDHVTKNRCPPSASSGETGKAFTKALYQCEICIIVFKRQKLLESHMEKYHTIGRKKYVCNKCPYTHKTFTFLLRHMKRHSRPLTSTGETNGASIMVKFQCEICDIYFENRTLFIRHIRWNHKENKKYACKKCDYTNRKFINVIEHERLPHPQSLTSTRKMSKGSFYSCKICNVSCNTKDVLSSHIQEYHRVFACDNCPYTNKDYTILTKHMNTCKNLELSKNTDITDEASTKTKNQSKTWYILYENRKYLAHTIGEYHVKYVCSKCTYAHQAFTNVTNHVRIEHPELLTTTGARYQCEICTTFCGNIESLRLHHKKCQKDTEKDSKKDNKKDNTKDTTKDSKEDNKFACTECTYTSKYLKELENHTRKWHSRFRTTIYCKVCLQILFTKWELKIHRDTHKDPSNSNLFMCPYCKKKYESYTDLEHHCRKNHVKSA